MMYANHRAYVKLNRAALQIFARNIFLLLALMALNATLGTTARAQAYHLVDLGTLGGTDSVATAINKSGRVTGSTLAADNSSRAYRTSAYLPIKLTDDLGPTEGLGINDFGVVVGDLDGQAFYYSTSKHIIPGLGYGSYAVGINSSGRIVGFVDQGFFVPGFLYAPGGAPMALGGFGGGATYPFAINDAGQIAGSSYDGAGNVRAFRTSPYTAIKRDDDLGALGGTNSRAFAINKAGVTVGTAETITGRFHAFRYAGNGPMEDLNIIAFGSTEAYALGINSAGKIVGTFDQNDGTSPRAFIWTPSGWDDLNRTITPGMFLQQANAINDSDCIVGYGLAWDNGAYRQHAFLLQPIQPKSLSILPPQIAGGLTATGKVTLNYLAPYSLFVKLVDNHPAASVDTSVWIPAGQVSATFPISTDVVTANTLGTIGATYGGVTKLANLTVMPISVQSLTLSPSPIVGSKPAVGTVTVELAAAPGDIKVDLSSADPTLVDVPAGVTVAAGRTTASFTVKTHPVAVQTTVAVSATANGRTKIGHITLKPIPPKFITIVPNTVTGGGTATGTVTLESPAGPGDISVVLTSSISAATVPSSVTVPMGAASASFTITTGPVGFTIHATISAKAGGVTKSAILTINP